MSVKRFTFVLALLALFTAVVSADDAPAPKGFALFGRWLSGPEALLYEPIVQDATGLEPEALRAALLEGSTLSELIAANDGDAESVMAELVAQAAESIHARAAATIEDLEASFNEAMEESHRRRFPWWRRRNSVRELFGAWGMDETVTAATGMDKTELNSALLEGATLAELIESNDGDVASVVSTLVAQASDGINAAAAARIQRYDNLIADAVDTDFSDNSRRWRKWRPRQGAFFSFRGVYDSSQPADQGSSQQAEAHGESEEA